jgi:hypothetical protein
MSGKVVCSRLTVASVAACAVMAAGAASASAQGWTIQPTPPVPGAAQPPDGPGGTGEGGFSGVSCASAEACAAVGQSSPGNAPAGYLAEDWDGTAWSMIEASNLEFDFGSQLLSVSCPASGACLAIGWGQPPQREAVAQTLSTAAAQDASPLVRYEIEEFLSVSCASTSFCMAVGNTGDGTAPLLIERWDGNGWTAQTPALPTDYQPSMLTGVSCASTSFCMAVGQDANANTAAERWDGTSWSLLPVPSPAGAASAALGAISCADADTCVAIGSWMDQSGAIHALVERLRHGAWELVGAPPATAGTEATLTGISCPLPYACTVVGSTADANGNTHAFAAGLRHDRWQVQATPAVPGATADALAAVSCPTARVCTAVGQSLGPADPATGTGTVTPLAERWIAGGHHRRWWHRRDRERSHRSHRSSSHRR